MKKEQIKAIVDYLQSVVDFDPRQVFQPEGDCMYCGVELENGQIHRSDCHYLKAQRLLVEFKGEIN